MDTTISLEDLFNLPSAETPKVNHTPSTAANTDTRSLRLKPFNLAKQVKDRTNGLTHDSFDADVLLYEEQLKSCEWPDEAQIYKEIKQWDFKTPTKECLNINKISVAYAKLNTYRHRLAELLAQATTYKNIASTAYKSLKETAFALYSGIQKEREANASYRVRPFELECIYAEGIVCYLKETERALETMFINMNCNLKHLDNLLYINSNYERHGNANNYDNINLEHDDISFNTNDNDDEEDEDQIISKKPINSQSKIRTINNYA